MEFSQSVIFAKWNFRKVAKFRKVEFHKVGMRKKWSANLIRRVNFEFANPVEIRKGCEFEDRELLFSKMIQMDFTKDSHTLCFFA